MNAVLIGALTKKVFIKAGKGGVGREGANNPSLRYWLLSTEKSSIIHVTSYHYHNAITYKNYLREFEKSLQEQFEYSHNI